MTAPNLFIVGAPKSGTTALGSYLDSHPDVYVAGSELSYFGSDLDFRTENGDPWHISWDAYCQWFAGHAEERYRADRSVFYLYSRRAAEEIHRYDPSSRIIVMLRHPVDQMYSEHSEMLFQGEEDLPDFAAALAAEDERRQGRRIPEGCRHPFALLYRDIASYADQLERYLSVFDREQVHIVIYDDLASDPAGVFREVLEFLDLEKSHRPEFTVVNGNKVVRSALLRRTLSGASPGLRRTARALVPSPRTRAQLRRRLQKLNTVARLRPPMDPGVRRELEAEFGPEVRRVETILGRQLPAWHRAPAP